MPNTFEEQVQSDLTTLLKVQGEQNERDLTFVTFMAESKECSKKCHRTHSTVFGNGSVGLRAKMWVVWGLLSITSLCIVVPLIVSYAKNHM